MVQDLVSVTGTEVLSLIGPLIQVTMDSMVSQGLLNHKLGNIQNPNEEYPEIVHYLEA